MNIHPTIVSFIATLKEDFIQLTAERKTRLGEIAHFIQNQVENGETAELIFICTHNSRRSHFGQIWAKVLADYHGVAVSTYSGGTEGTAFHPNSIRALKSLGFVIDTKDAGPNPHYNVAYSDGPSMQAWSKVYSDPANPQQGFCAIMTCSEADEACPMVLGAAKRVSLPFEDPKKSDGTPEEAATYLARARQIAMEMAFVFEQISQS